jgi:hypothetical protein
MGRTDGRRKSAKSDPCIIGQARMLHIYLRYESTIVPLSSALYTPGWTFYAMSASIL